MRNLRLQYNKFNLISLKNSKFSSTDSSKQRDYFPKYFVGDYVACGRDKQNIAFTVDLSRITVYQFTDN